MTRSLLTFDTFAVREDRVGKYPVALSPFRCPKRHHAEEATIGRSYVEEPMRAPCGRPLNGGFATLCFTSPSRG